MGALTSPAVWLDYDHPVVRRGMAASLEGADMRVAGEGSGFEPRPAASGLHVLVFQAERGGIGRAAQFAAEADVELIALLRRPTDALVSEAISAGVASVLSFTEMTPASLVSTVRAVVHGTVTLSPDLLPRLLEQAQRGRRAHPENLTDRELKVLALLAEGESTRGIAGRIAFSERTVKNLVHDMLLKMNCRNRPHAVAQATRQGII